MERNVTPDITLCMYFTHAKREPYRHVTVQRLNVHCTPDVCVGKMMMMRRDTVHCTVQMV